MIPEFAPEFPHLTHLPDADHFSVSRLFIPFSQSLMKLEIALLVNQQHLLYSLTSGPVYPSRWYLRMTPTHVVLGSP